MPSTGASPGFSSPFWTVSSVVGAASILVSTFFRFLQLLLSLCLCHGPRWLGIRCRDCCKYRIIEASQYTILPTALRFGRDPVSLAGSCLLRLFRSTSTGLSQFSKIILWVNSTLFCLCFGSTLDLGIFVSNWYDLDLMLWCYGLSEKEQEILLFTIF